MTSSSTTKIVYALGADPGVSCAFPIKYPDVRQFDERIYQNDQGPTGPPVPPAALNAIIAKNEN